MNKTFNLITLLLSFSLLEGFATTNQHSAAKGNKAVVVFAVRHAEKVHQGKDPELSETGKERAALLAQMLQNAEIDFVHASPYIRTQTTAEPTAKVFDVDIQDYDPRNLPNLVKKILKMGGRHLVVGHSNTTPQLIELLTNETTDEINEAVEFDRLYIVTINKEGESSSILLRYGQLMDKMESE